MSRRATARERRIAEHRARIAPLSIFPQDKQDEIAVAVAQPMPPAKWLALGVRDDPLPLAWIISRAWVEWHLTRGVDPFEVKRDKIPPRIRAAVLARDGLACQLCGGEVDAGDVHLDHIKPWSLGGRHEVENLQVTHSLCNIRKGARV